MEAKAPQRQARDRHAHADTEAPPPDDSDDGGGGEPLLIGRQQRPEHGPPAADGGRRRRMWRSVPWPTLLGFGFLTFNSGMAIYRSQGDRGAVSFVAFSYLDLIMLFTCLRWYESAQPDSVTRAWLKVAVWLLTTLLTLLFSAKVAAVTPAAVAVVVWLMAFATVAGGFYAFFLHSDKQ
ncbi:unnamed protein product [Urochloa humidicola]